ncbi:hypothetical protein [Pedobacter sp. UBA4863]|uniref:hypothetical protein n=1 Tax=Pedobacter sp. UBA4863 TaxID=1947060 RepID=UPI0025FA9FCD|nr:hypothetical protein [Pedobacter sp. UBA4863]
MKSDDLFDKVNNSINDFNQLYNLDGIELETLHEINKERKLKVNKQKERLNSESIQPQEPTEKFRKKETLTSWAIAILLCVVAYLLMTNF